MKTINLLRVLIILFIFGNTIFSLSAQRIKSFQPENDIPIIVDDRGKPIDPLVQYDACMPTAFNIGSVSYIYEYELIAPPSDYTKISFNFQTNDPNAGPLQIHSPPSATGNTFGITFYNLGNYGPNPSGPYNAYYDQYKNAFIFDLNFSVEAPSGFPNNDIVDLTITRAPIINNVANKIEVSTIQTTLCEVDNEEESNPPATGRISHEEASNSLKAKPNPFSNYLELEFKASEEKQAEIVFLNLSGQKIEIPMKAKYAGSENWLVYVNTESLIPGVYLIQVNTNNGTLSRKIVKQ